MTTPPSNSLIARASASIDTMSKWFVGSSVARDALRGRQGNGARRDAGAARDHMAEAKQKIVHQRRFSKCAIAQDLITYRAIECVGAPTQVGRTQRCKCDMHEAHKRSMNQRVGIPVTQTIGEVLDRRGLVRSGDTKAAELCSPCLQERGRRWGRYIISKRRRK